jgi:hypothetical protein
LTQLALSLGSRIIVGVCFLCVLSKGRATNES